MSNFDTLTKARIAIKIQVDKLNDSLSERKKELAELDTEILDHLTKEGQDGARANGYSFSIQRQKVYNATDWAAFCEFAEENRCSHLFQKRLTQKSVEEAVALYGDAVPVDTFEKISLNTRKTPK